MSCQYHVMSYMSPVIMCLQPMSCHVSLPHVMLPCHMSLYHDCTHSVMIMSCYVSVSGYVMWHFVSHHVMTVSMSLCVICHSVSHHVMTVSQVMVVCVMLCLTWVPWVVTLGVTWVSLSWDMGCGPYLIHVIRPSCPLPSSECLGPFHGFDLRCPFVYPSLDLVLDCTLTNAAMLAAVGKKI